MVGAPNPELREFAPGPGRRATGAVGSRPRYYRDITTSTPTRIALLFALAAAACSAPKRSSTIPDPAGQSYQEYLGTERPAPPVRPPDTDPSQAMTFHFIDVGQGTSILLEFPCGAVLIDTGGENNAQFDSRAALLGYLDRFFERRRDLDRTLDLLVITHQHIDHDRWVMDVLDRYGVKNIIDNGVHESSLGGTPMNEMHQWLAELGTGVGHRDILASDIDSKVGMTGPIIDPVGSCDASAIDPEIRALWGQVTEDMESYGHNPNNHSVVLRIDFGKSSALLVGDLEVLGLARMSDKFKANPGIFDIDLYQVGHHGSRNATVEYFMRAMSPKLAVIPVGPYERKGNWTANAFGHPNLVAIKHLIDPDYGVSLNRAEPKKVWVGIKGAWKDRPSQFEQTTIIKAVYAVGWDGAVDVTANANGWIDVHTAR